MTRLFPRSSQTNLRVFLACLLSFMTLIAPIASVAAATRNDSRASSASSADAKSKATAEEKLESYLFSNSSAAPVATPDITATKAATFTDSDGDNKAELGETITYNVNVANAGPGDATNVTFTDTIDPNTTLVPGSLKVSPLAFADTYTTPKNTPLNTSAPGVLANDTGTPAPTVSQLNGSPTLTGSTTGGGTVTIFADGHFNYSPNPTFEGADTFTYTVTNGQAPDDTATVTINVDAAPTVTATTPVNGATGVTTSATITVTFSESVSATASAFSIQCPVGTPITFSQSASPATTFTLTPTSPLPAGVTCTVNVDKDEISDTDSFDPPDNMAADYTFSFSTDAAPEVTTTSPTNGAPSVAANVNITVNFSEAVTANTSAFTLECPTGTGKTFTVSGSGTSSITLDPTADLPFGTLCTVTVIGANIHDLDANDPPDTMVGNYAFSFTVDSQPTVTTTTPTNGATDVAGNANIIVNFSEPVNVTASAFTIQCPVGSPVTYTLTPAAPGASSSFTLDPTVTLPGGVTCTVTVVANQVTDTDSFDPPDTMAANYVFSFTVDSAPSVTTTSPVNGATNVAANANIIVNFSESVNVTASAFTLECPVGTPTAFTLTPAVPGPASSYTLNPNADLPFGVTCTVTVVAAQVTDNDANDPPDNMVANFVFTFTVDSPPSVTATTPANNATGVAVTTNIDITFSEAVDATTSSFTIQCPTGSGNQAYALSNNAGKTIYTLNPTANLPAGAICTVTVIANQISDTDTGDPPDNMLADYVFTFKIPPVANADTYPQTVIGNVNINSANIPYSVVTNDLYAAADPVTITKVDATTTVVSNTITTNTAQGGTVVMIVSGADVGKFTYNPPAGYEGNDAFTYEITNGGGSATATVTVPIAGMVWFINNNAATCTTRVNGCGRLSNPYSDLGSFNTENNGGVGSLNPAVNDNIFIYESATAYNNAVTLLTGQRLIGQDSTSSLSTLTGLNPPSGSAPFPAMNSGNATITKITTGSGAGITLNSTGTAGTNTVNGLTVGNTAGAGIQGLNFGTVNIADVSINEPSSTRTGQALFLDGQANTIAVNATFINVTSSSSATTNVSLVRTTGTINLGTGALSGSTGNAFSVTGAGNTATISYAGTITNSTSRAVNIQNKTGGTVTFSGLINSTGSGIFLDTNTGTTMNFTGGVTLNGANAGFTATNGGTVSVTDPNANGTAPDNTINATSVTALNVTNTTIGAGNLNFRSISSGNNTAAADPASGIILNSTGASGSLIVSGSNSAAAGGDDSGGTIQNTTSIGISLTNTLSPSFTNVKIDTTAGSGVKGTTVTNFTFKNGKVLNSNNGAVEAADESNIAFNNGTGTENNISGVVTITNNTLTNALYHGVDILNFNGTISDAQISGNAITSTTSAATSLGSGIRFRALGSATAVANVTKATLNGNTILNFPVGAGILAFGGNGDTAGGAPAGIYGTAGSATNIINITNNTIQGASSANKMGTFAIQANVNGRGQGNFNISNNGTIANPIRDVLGNVISHSSTGVANVTSVISNNVIVANHQPAFGGPFGISVGAGQVTGIGDTATLSVSITGNNVSQTDSSGIRARVAEGHASLNITIKNNTVAAPLDVVGGSAVGNGIRIDAGGGASDIDNPVCLDISGNTSAGENGQPGIGLRKEGTVANVHDFGIEGLSPSPATAAQTQTFVTSQNPGSSAGVIIISGDNFISCSSAPVGMYKPEKTQRFETARANEAAKPATKLGEQAALAEKLFISKDEAITHHDNTAVATKPVTQKVAQVVALRSKTSEIVKTAKAQPMAQPMAQTVSSRSASQVFTSHATSNKAKAQPAANSFLSPAAPAAPSGETVNATIGTLPAGKSVTISFQVTVNTAGSFTGTSPQVSNQGTVGADDPNGGTITVLTDDTTVGGANNPTVTPVDSQPDLQITKTDGAVVAVPGGTISYTLAYNNTNGKRDANNTVITETIPANTVFNAGASTAGWSCPGGTSAGNTCTLAVGNIPAGGAGGSATFAVTVVNPVPAGVTGLSNTATIADDGLFGADGNPANNTSTVLTSLNAAINLSINKSDGNTGSSPGQTISYTLTYANIGNKGATGVVLNETVPANTTFNAGASTAGWSCAAITAGSACTFTIGALAGGGAGGSVVFAVTADDPVPGGTTQISNTATISDDGTNGADADTGNNTSSDTTPFDAPPTLGTYSNTVVVFGQSTTVSPTAPPADDKPGFTVAVAAPGFTGGLTVNQTTGVVSITNAAPVAAAAYTVTVTVTDSIGQMTIRTFQLTVNKANTTTTVTASPNPSDIGQQVTFTATVAAVSPGSGTPTGTVDFLDGATIICDDAALNGSGQATCQISSLTAGAHTITANYNGSASFNTSSGTLPTQTVNEVNISGRKYTDNNGDGDDEAGADPGLNGVTIELYNDVNSNGTYEAGTDTLAATTTTANVSGQDGRYSFDNKVPGRYIVREVLPAGYQQTAPAAVNPATEGIYAINGSGSGGNFTAKDFGNFQLITISGRKFDDLNGNGSDEGGSDPGLNGFTIQLYNDVNGNGTLELSGGTPDTLKASTTTANVAGVDGKYSFTNVGPGKYIVREVVPAGYLQTAPASPGTYAITAASGVDVTGRDFGNFHKSTTTTVTSSLNPSFFTDPVTFTATVVANPPASGTPTGTVTFFDGANPICSNVALNGSGQATCTTSALAAGSHTITAQYSGDTNFTSSTGALPVPQVVVAKADLAVTKVDTPDPVVVGNNITYTISFTNNGPSAASSVTVTDAVPTNTTFVSAAITTGPGWSISSQPAGGGTGNVVFSKASVPSGETATFQVVVNVNPATADLTVITNNAVAASTTTDLTSGNNTGTTTTTVRRPGILQFSAPTYTVNENVGTATIDVNRTSGSGGTVTVHYTITNGTASAADYTGPTSGTLTFNNGDTVKSISIPIVSDSLDEVNETLNLALDTPTGGAVLGAQTTAVLTITDDDPTPSLSINDVTVTEGNSGTVDATFTVTLSAASGQTVTVNYATADGTATIADSDYQAAPSTMLTFNPGETTKTVTVKVNGDLFYEFNEDFFVNLSGQTNSTIADASGRGVITNDDAQPTLSINDVTMNEGNSGTTSFVFTVTLTGQTHTTTTVNYATADGTATVANNDYQAIPSTVLTFLPGETTKTITVLVNGDPNAEANENFFVNLSGAVNATITDNQGLGTITSDDTPLIGLSASTYSVGEGDLRATITVNRLGDLSQPARVDYLTSDTSGLNLCSQITGNASERCDYATVAGTLRFAAGETSKVINIPIVDDVYLDGPEVFTLTLSNAVGGDIAGINVATITIIDNDTAPAANPIDNDAFFIRQLYIDFLGREPEPGAVAAWLGILNHCAIPTDCDRIAVARGFVRSPEFQDRGFFVYRTYKTLGRIAHYNEFIPDMAKLSGFLSPADLEANKAAYILEFMNRTEFKTLYNPTIGNPTAYVDKLLQSVQLPAHPGRAGWIAGLTNGTLTRAQVLRQLIDSGELYTAYVNEAFIIMNYFGFLRRDADASYLVWIDIFNHTNDDRVIINGFLNSLEYRLRFGPN